MTRSLSRLKQFILVLTTLRRWYPLHFFQILPERNLAVELLERLLEGEIRSKFTTNVVQHKKFSDLLTVVITRYQNRSIETAQVMEELMEMAKKFKASASRGEQLGLSEDEVKFCDALANNESAMKELANETLKKIAHELTENLKKNFTVDWAFSIGPLSFLYACPASSKPLLQ